MPKRATVIILSGNEWEELTQIVKRRRSEQRAVLRARIVLAAAQGKSNVEIARELDINVDTVRLWRDRWAGLQGIDLQTLSIAERLQDAPRPGVTPKITAEQRCQMAALAYEAPSKAERPISQWTGREIADEMRARGIVEQISPRHAARLLKKGDCMLKRGQFTSLDDLRDQILAFIAYYNRTMAKPIKWTYTGFSRLERKDRI